jgi:hypothetical protein
MRKLILILGVAMGLKGVSQNVGIGTATPNSKAILDLSSTNSVLLLPRMTNTQMDAISNPPYGSLVYNTDQHQF